MAHDTHMLQFGEPPEWNDLHDCTEWRLPSDSPVGSEKVQRSHFEAFFRATHRLRCTLVLSRTLAHTMQALKDALRRWNTSPLWLQLRWGLRLRLLLKRRVRALCTAAAQRRRETLESWLAYWEEGEARVHDQVRARLAQSPKGGTAGLTAAQAGQLAEVRVLASTPEQVKQRVLWELYWLLHTQYATQKHEHWVRWRALLRKQAALREQQARATRRSSPRFALDFMHREPVTLRAVNAALFVEALQAPRFRYRAGCEVTLPELMRLATAPQRVFAPSDVEVPLRHASAVVTTFQDSPLCSDPAWLHRRYGRPVPLIPEQTWHAQPAQSPRLGGPGEDLRSDTDDWLPLRALGRTSPAQPRRLNSSFCSSV
eukprot:EG_transcript_16855